MFVLLSCLGIIMLLVDVFVFDIGIGMYWTVAELFYLSLKLGIFCFFLLLIGSLVLHFLLIIIQQAFASPHSLRVLAAFPVDVL